MHRKIAVKKLLLKRSQGSGPSSTTFLGHKQAAKREVEQQGYEATPIWDPSTRKVRILATRLWCSAHDNVPSKISDSSTLGQLPLDLII